jgi:hypothetical protein
MSYQLHPGQYNSFMDGRVAQELKDNAGNLFFDPKSLEPNKICLGVTWSINWYASTLPTDQLLNDSSVGSV